MSKRIGIYTPVDLGGDFSKAWVIADDLDGNDRRYYVVVNEKGERAEVYENQMSSRTENLEGEDAEKLRSFLMDEKDSYMQFLRNILGG